MVRPGCWPAADRCDEAIEAADEAVLLAYSTQQASERAAAEELRATLWLTVEEPVASLDVPDAACDLRRSWSCGCPYGLAPVRATTTPRSRRVGGRRAEAAQRSF
jgi:hypothetical protein